METRIGSERPKISAFLPAGSNPWREAEAQQVHQRKHVVNGYLRAFPVKPEQTFSCHTATVSADNFRVSFHTRSKGLRCSTWYFC